MKSAILSAIVALSVVAGCAPTPEDEAKMAEMMAYEAEQAAAIEKNPADCKKIETDLAEITKANKDKQAAVTTWWDGLSSGKREKLLEKNKDGKYKLAMAMMKGVPCMDAIKAGMKAK
jgi:hypothetical protein